MTPVYVGTDANISYQGTPRVENPTGDSGPFEQPQASRPPVAQPRPAPPPARRAAAPINLAPGSGPSDIFRPAAEASAAAAASAVPPQPKSAVRRSVVAPPARRAVAPRLRSGLPRARSRASSSPSSCARRRPGGLPETTLAIRFDPAVVAVVVRDPILGSGAGVADASIEAGRVVIEIPGLGGALRHARRRARSRCAASPRAARRCRSSPSEMRGRSRRPSVVQTVDGRPMIRKRAPRRVGDGGLHDGGARRRGGDDRDPRGDGRARGALLAAPPEGAGAALPAADRCATRSTSTSSSPTPG